MIVVPVKHPAGSEWLCIHKRGLVCSLTMGHAGNPSVWCCPNKVRLPSNRLILQELVFTEVERDRRSGRGTDKCTEKLTE